MVPVQKYVIEHINIPCKCSSCSCRKICYCECVGTGVSFFEMIDDSKTTVSNYIIFLILYALYIYLIIYFIKLILTFKVCKTSLVVVGIVAILVLIEAFLLVLLPCGLIGSCSVQHIIGTIYLSFLSLFLIQYK